MAKTKADYTKAGADHAREGCPRFYAHNDSWQAQCYNAGYDAAQAEITKARASAKAEAGQGQSVKDFKRERDANLPRDTMAGISIPFPASMPEPTREHIRSLESQQAQRAGDGAFLVRTAKKIEKLYARHSC